jgi:hypothetical protein
MTRAKKISHKCEYLIFMKNIFLEKIYTWSVYTCKYFRQKLVLFWAIKKKKI